MSATRDKHHMQLVNLVHRLVAESGDIEGFDAVAWVDRWLAEPLPAIGNRLPEELLSTKEGYAVLESVLQRAQSGAYG